MSAQWPVEMSHQERAARLFLLGVRESLTELTELGFGPDLAQKPWDCPETRFGDGSSSLFALETLRVRDETLAWLTESITRNPGAVDALIGDVLLPFHHFSLMIYHTGVREMIDGEPELLAAVVAATVPTGRYYDDKISNLGRTVISVGSDACDYLEPIVDYSTTTGKNSTLSRSWQMTRKTFGILLQALVAHEVSIQDEQRVINMLGTWKDGIVRGEITSDDQDPMLGGLLSLQGIFRMSRDHLGAPVEWVMAILGLSS